MRLLLTSLVIALVVTTTPAQRQSKRIVTCYVREIQEVSPELQAIINDTLLIHLPCRNHARLRIPAYKWPEEWGEIQVGKRVRFVDYRDGRHWLPLR